MTQEEIMVILRNFLDSEGRLKLYPSKKKMKLYAIYYLSMKFAAGERYAESEVNGILNRWHTFGDAAMLRRELYDYHFLGRERDGSTYWPEETQPVVEELIAAVK